MFIDRDDDPRAGSGGGGGSPAAAVDHLAEIARLESEIAKLQGAQMVHMAAHVAAVEGSDRTYIKQATASAFAEINLVLHASGRHADNRIDEACALAAVLPRTLAAVCAGQLSAYRARVILDQTVGLSGPELAEAEEQALAVAARLTPAKLRQKLARIVAAINPEAVITRRSAEVKKRHVSVHPQPDGMAGFYALLSAERAQEMFGVIDTAARAAKAPGDERTLEERRADTLYDLICHPHNGEQRVHWHGQVLIPLGTVLGLNGEPGYLPGYGPIPADLCRELAADATWRRILTDPVTNTTLDIAPRRYRPPKRLSRFIHFRDKTCRWPGCNRTVVDTDHTIRRENGGLTVRANLGDLCEHHHDLKDAPGWKVVQDDGTFTFITPSGRVYRTRPPGADGEVKPVEEIVIPKPPPRPKAPLPPEADPPPF